MAIPYRPPGVLPVVETSSIPLAPGNAFGEQIPCLIGEARGYETYTEPIAPTGTATVELAKKGIQINDSTRKQLSFTVQDALTFKTISPANFLITQTAGTATGDETTTFRRVDLPEAPSIAAGSAGTVIASGQYRYAVSWVIDIDTSGGTAYYETGLGPAGTVTVASDVETIELTNITNGTAAVGATVTGRNIYRSINNGTSNNPNWGPWYRLTGAGTTTIDDSSTSTYSDSASSVAANPNEEPGIASGNTVNVQYNYANVSYFEPTLFVDFNDIEDKYGPAFSATGTIDSELSFGAKVAMLNGASTVILLALPEGATSGDWTNALLKLEDDEDATMVVPLSGSATYHAGVVAHLATMANRNIFKVAVLGKDGVNDTLTDESVRNAAIAYNNKSVIMVSPSIVRYYNSYLNREIDLGGQYLAAAYAGMRSANRVGESLTRKTVAGFSSLGLKKNSPQKNQDAGSGLCVFEEISPGTIRCRHDITTAPAAVNTREAPVIFQRNQMLRGVLAYLDSAVVGKYKTNEPEAPALVAAGVGGYLNSLIRQGIIGGASGVSAAFDPNDPTTLLLRWQYRPIYTVQFIAITIGVDLTSGDVQVGTGNAIL